MKKRILSILLAFVMVVGLLPATALAAAGDNAIKLELVKDTKTFAGKEVLRMDFYYKSGSDTPNDQMVYLKANEASLSLLNANSGNAASATILSDFSVNRSAAITKNNYTFYSREMEMNVNSEAILYCVSKGGYTYIGWKITENKDASDVPAFADFTRISSIFFGLKEGVTFDAIPGDAIGYSDPKVDGSITATSSAAEITVNGGGDGNVYKYKNKDTAIDTMTVAPAVTAGEGVTIAKPALTGTPTISGTVKVGEVLTADVSGLNDSTNITYQWKRGGAAISGATNSSYTLTAADAGCKITVAVTATSASSYGGTVTSAETTAVANAAQSTPALNSSDISKTATTITVTANSGWEYSKDGGFTWQPDNVFTGLMSNTSYQICVRLAAKTGYDASPASSVQNVTTDKAPAGDPVVPVVASKTDKSITVTAVSGQKYMIKKATDSAPNAGDSGWADTVVFTGLEPNTAYRVYTYIPESSIVAASAVVYTEATTDKTSITALVSVSDLNKTYTAEAQEPTFFSSTLTSGTDYTVTYALKEAGKGELKDNKPCGAGTYVVTVSGAGSYGSSFTKDFTISKKEVTITPASGQSKTYGEADPEQLTYTTSIDSETTLKNKFNDAKSGALSRVAGDNVGSYAIKPGTLAAGPNFNLTLATPEVNFTINAKNVTADRGSADQTVVKGVGDFTEPTFGDVTGTLVYSYDSATTYEGVKAKLAALSTDATGTINYTYTATGNYTGSITGSISFTVVDVTFVIETGAITVAGDPTYGMKWSEIVSYDPVKITAKVGTNVCDNPSFTLQNDSEYPNYGSQTYTITFSGTIGGVEYTNVTVKSDSVSIGKATVTVTAGTYEVSKTYDGTTTAGTATGELSVSGILSKDTGVTVTATVGTYSNANVGGQDEVDVSLAISGDTNNNYQLESTTVSVPCEITKATLTVEGTASAAADYGTALKNIPITGLTVKLGSNVVTGTWAFSGETVLDADNSSDYTATFTPADGAGNYNTLTKGITPTINKVDYTGSAIATTKNVLTNTAVNNVDVDMTSLLAGIKGAAVSAASESSDTDNIISNVSTDGNKVKFDVASIAAKDKSATINVTISSTNYNPITATITVTTVDKAEAGVSISGAPTSKTYGDADFTLTASVTDPGTGTGTWTWTSSDPAVLQVTGSSAAATVKVLKAGSATITAKYESDTTMGEQTTAPITVSKRVITVTADNKSMTVNGTLPTFTVTYGNLPSGVQAEDIFGTLASASTTTDGKTTGSFDITVTTPVLKTEAGANYEVGAVTKGTLTVNPRSSSGGGGGGSAATPSVSDKAAKELKNAKEGSTVAIDMKGETKLPASVTKEIAGKDVTVELDMGGGMVWSFNGLDVPKGGVKLDLGVKTGTKAIPAKVINALTGEMTTVQLQLNHNGSFGMSLKLSVDLGKKHDGLYANLYFYNPKSSALEFRSAGMISGGKASWAFDHASDYAIVIDKESHEPMTFIDVPDSAYYAEAVNWAVAKKITGGIGNGLFAPNDPCTRAQIVTFLWRAAGSPAPKNMGSFTDVPADAFYAKAVAWAVENGITGGTGDGKFSPDATCTRAQSVTFLYRAAGSPKVSGSAEFGDVATNAYYADAVAWAAKNGITGGTSATTFSPSNNCTRAQIVTFLFRCLGE